MIPRLPVRRFCGPSPIRDGKTEPSVEAHGPQPEAIYVRSSNFAVGPHSPDEIERALACGRILATDQAWHKRLHHWTSLSAILDRAGEKTFTIPGADDNQFFDRVADSFRRAASELGESLVTLLRPLQGDDSLERWDDVLLSSLGRAGTFHARCSEVLATAVRYFASSDVLRQTPVQRLSKEIRQEGFGAADKLVRTFAIEVTTGETRSREQRLHEYLVTLGDVPLSLVDCVSAKGYVASVNAEQRQACIRACSAECDKIVKTILPLMKNHPSRRASATAAKARQEHKAKLKTRRYIRFAACFVISAIAGIVNLAKGDFSVESAAGFTVTLTAVFYIILSIVGW